VAEVGVDVGGLIVLLGAAKLEGVGKAANPDCSKDEVRVTVAIGLIDLVGSMVREVGTGV